MSLHSNDVQPDAVLRSLQDAVFVLDADCTFVYANERLCETICTPQADLLGEPLTAVQPYIGEGFSALGEAIERVLVGAAADTRVDLRTEHPDAAPVPRHLAAVARVTRLDDDRLDGAVVVLRDISRRKDRESSLQRRADRFQTLFEGHAAPMLLIDPGSGDIRDANRAAAEFYGYDRTQLTNMPIQAINCKEDGEVERERHRASQQECNRFEFEHQLASGERRTVEVYSSPVTIDGESLLVSIIHDITERKQYEHRLTLFKQAVEQTGHAVLITDRDGCIEYVNSAFETQTGFEKAEALGRTPRILNSGRQDPRFYEALWETILDGDLWEADLINQRKSGELYYATQTIAPILRDGEITNFVAVQSDITDQKLRVKRVRELNRLLRHNIRNTLSSIIASAEVLRENPDVGETEHADRIVDQAERLAATSKKVTLVHRHLETDAHSKGDCAIENVVRTLAAEIRKDRPDVTVETQVAPATVGIERDVCRILLDELVGNALIHNDHETPRLSISVTAAGDQSGQVDIDVADNGPGITEQERSAVDLTPDGQLSHASGIGLSHVHWVVTECGGEVHISDNEPRGSVVSLSLPRGDDG